jgi:hypothetical protein
LKKPNEVSKAEETAISSKLKEDIKKLQELTLEANKIMTDKVNPKEEIVDVFNSPGAFLKVSFDFDYSKDQIMDLYQNKLRRAVI